MNPGSADSISGSFRILKAGEKRASELLKEKETELHRVSVPSAPPPLLLIPDDVVASTAGTCAGRVRDAGLGGGRA